jgi:hypothetical protein
MLARLTKRFRLKAAIGLAVLYAVCVLGPHAAMALDSAGAAHCLTENSAAAHVHKTGTQASHVHTNGETHHHDGASHHDTDSGQTPTGEGHNSKDHSGTCCGLFCLSAIAADDVAVLAPLPSVSASLPGLAESLAGRAPGRINRPPIG